MTFAEGVQVAYKDQIGVIRFICDQYLTICVKRFDERNRDVCLIVYRSNYNQISLLKESIK
jgi:hypothetical protein